LFLLAIDMVFARPVRVALGDGAGTGRGAQYKAKIFRSSRWLFRCWPVPARLTTILLTTSNIASAQQQPAVISWLGVRRIAGGAVTDSVVSAAGPATDEA
jgi:hypothetical protein